ncbi:LacI family DNA-binding transcriptional regulator [Ciceribacter thiooxidans]|uniref:LacI family DNA-binding transcriptional regulator n=2 Tax=Ciceribacter thiooxidans TaxID=1969821 RepID=A0ABV7I7J6_9HYPH
MRKPILEDVAAAAGVSKMTASRALRGAGDVSKDTISKVRQAAERVGYVGNRLALSLSSRRTNLIGVVVPSMSNIVFPEVLSGISETLEGTGMQAVFGLTDYDPGKEREVIRNMLSWRPAAMIVTGLDQPEETVKLLKQAEVPVIQIMDIDGTPIDYCVGLSHTAAGEEMGRALLQEGRRKFGYVGSRLDRDQRASRRKAGFERALAEAGLRFISVRVGEQVSSAVLGKRLTIDLLADPGELDCIYYSNDDMAAGGLFACIERKISVPETILLAGFNGLELTDALPAAIATSYSPRREIGRTAANLALRALGDAGTTSERIVALSPKLSLRRQAATES